MRRLSSSLNTLMQAYVKEITVAGRDGIYPSFFVPAVSPPSFSVEAAGSTDAKNRSTEPESLSRASRLLPSRAQTRLQRNNTRRVGTLQSLPGAVLGRVAVG